MRKLKRLAGAEKLAAQTLRVMCAIPTFALDLLWIWMAATGLSRDSARSLALVHFLERKERLESTTPVSVHFEQALTRVYHQNEKQKVVDAISNDVLAKAGPEASPFVLSLKAKLDLTIDLAIVLSQETLLVSAAVGKDCWVASLSLTLSTFTPNQLTRIIRSPYAVYSYDLQILKFPDIWD